MISAFANNKDKNETIIKKWNATGTYQSIAINTNVDVLLIEDTLSVIKIEGDARVINAVSFSIGKW